MNKKQPFFSIVIPTFNRSECLNYAIKSILRQEFINFEIVISDNASTDNTKKVCEDFFDDRIKYFCNEGNVGFAKNLFFAIKRAKGKYIFLLGDDDLLLSDQILTNLYKTIIAESYGYLRLNFLCHSNYDYLFDYFKLKNIKAFVYSSNNDNYTTYKYLYSSIFHFISGVIFKNNKNIRIPSLYSKKNANNTMDQFFVEYIFPQVKSHGGIIMKNDYIIANWSSSKSNFLFYTLYKGRIYLENNWKFILNRLSKSERKKWIQEDTLEALNVLPSIKYYTNRQNLAHFIKRILQLNEALYFQPKLYIYTILAFLFPDVLFQWIRNITQKKAEVHDIELIKEFEKLKKELSIK